MLIFGFAGPAGCGKTTAANMIKGILGGGVILPMAKPLKDFARALGWDGKKDARGRRLLQLLGTDCGRECISEDIWVNKWQAAVNKSGAEVIATDDVRFENESAKIREMGGTIIHITGRQLYYDKSEISSHPSEAGIHILPGDVLVDNSGSLEELKCRLDEITKI
jgi:energy-coupling factor transporter ATP-binding protein EcfA2